MCNWGFMRSSSMRSAAVAVSMALTASHLAGQNAYVQTNLVSGLSGVAAATDANMINPWGISSSATSPFWVSNAGTGTSTLYSGAGTVLSLVVAIPPPSGSMVSIPTGTVFNLTSIPPATPAFLVAGTPSRFLFSTIGGTIAAWDSGTTAITEVDNSGSGASYTGLALGAGSGGPLLYAPNFHAGTVDVFDGTFAPVTTDGGFRDWFLPKGYAPFGIMTEPNNNVIVTYALQNATATSDVAGAGHGFVDEFDADGHLLRRLISGGALDSPWGLAMAPATGFGNFSGALLVGNFGDGRINAYSLPTGGMDPDMPHLRASIRGEHEGGFSFFREFRGATFIDTMRDPNGRPITNLGLWGLRFGNGTENGGAATSLYFAAGIPGSVGALSDIQKHGLFGVINVQMTP